MSDVSFKICGVALICAVMIAVLRSAKPESAFLLRMASTVLICGGVIGAMLPLINFLSSLFEESAVSVYAETMIKALGVALITHICASVCRDCGENTVAGYAELGGKIEILILALPMLREILETASCLTEMI